MEGMRVVGLWRRLCAVTQLGFPGDDFDGDPDGLSDGLTGVLGLALKERQVVQERSSSCRSF